VCLATEPKGYCEVIMSECDISADHDVTPLDVNRFYRLLRDGQFGGSGFDSGGLRPPQGRRIHAPRGFDRALVGVIIYIVEAGLFLLQRQDKTRVENPGRLCIFSGTKTSRESLTRAAVRELGEETSLIKSPRRLIPHRAYVEDRTPEPVFRGIFVLLLDRMPRELHSRDGAGIEAVRITRTEDTNDLNWLSREDISMFLDDPPMRRAA
jgi:8-oxo-dGTP pyrophosphatase MutT (NUDIX family)